jgi:hypothetical protein
VARENQIDHQYTRITPGHDFQLGILPVLCTAAAVLALFTTIIKIYRERALGHMLFARAGDVIKTHVG